MKGHLPTAHLILDPWVLRPPLHTAFNSKSSEAVFAKAYSLCGENIFSHTVIFNFSQFLGPLMKSFAVCSFNKRRGRPFPSPPAHTHIQARAHTHGLFLLPSQPPSQLPSSLLLTFPFWDSQTAPDPTVLHSLDRGSAFQSLLRFHTPFSKCFQITYLY